VASFLLALAIAAGLVAGICFNNRTAWPLLGSVVLCLYLRERVVPFDPLLWFLIDLEAALFIIRRNMPVRDYIIIGLFVPAWVSYALPDPWRNWGSSAVVITQLLLTVPLRKNQGMGGLVSHGPLREVTYEKGAR
jgi:hypothetical protein